MLQSIFGQIDALNMSPVWSVAGVRDEGEFERVTAYCACVIDQSGAGFLR